MKVLHTLLLLSALGTLNLFSQTFDGDLSLNTQAEVDNFEYQNVTGNLVISNTNAITNLDGLSILTEIGGNLEIKENTVLQDISGLDNLVDVADIEIISNPLLYTIGTFNSINHADDIDISGNNQLESINILNNAVSITGLYIDYNDNLVTINGLENAVNMTGTLRIIFNESLISLSGFNNIYKIFADCIITDNPVLTSIPVFEGLEDVRRLIIRNCFSLQQFTSFSSLQVTKAIYVIDNPNLQTIPTFDSLTDVGISPQDQSYYGIYIENNASLKNIIGFNQLLTAKENIWIGLNSSLEKIEGFENLTIIGNPESGNLEILANPNLKVINGFESLETVRNEIIIADNDQLKLINDFSNLTTINQISISNNNNLYSISGFNSIVGIGNKILINNNNNLLSVSGFDALLTTPILDIVENENLCSINGLNGILIIESSYSILNNPALESCCMLNCLVQAPSSSQIIEGNSTACQNYTTICDPDCNDDCTGVMDACGICDGAGPTYFYADFDNDGLGDPNLYFTICCGSTDGITDFVDNNLDDCLTPLDGFCDCDGLELETVWYADTDNDGLGDPNVSYLGCFQLGYVSNSNDDCDGILDECGVCNGSGIPEGVCDCDGTPPPMWYADTDNDGLGDPNSFVNDCVQPSGYVSNSNDDCDGELDECGVCNGNGIPEGVCDCDGILPPTWYADTDNDGLGDPDNTLTDCIQPAGYVSNSNDDCDGEYDECGVCNGVGIPLFFCDCEFTFPTTWYADFDNDGLGDPNNSITDCEQPDGYVSNADDTDVTTGVDDIEDIEISVYPNPARDYLNISIDSQIDFEQAILYNQYGQEMLKSNETQFDISGLSAGVYMVLVYDTERVKHIAKFIKLN